MSPTLKKQLPSRVIHRIVAIVWLLLVAAAQISAADLDYSVTWVGNSFSGAEEKWVQNFFIHTAVQPDGTVNTWSHWDEGGRRFGLYKAGDVIGNEDRKPNSLETRDVQGRTWKLHVRYTDPKHQEWEFLPEKITCDGRQVTFPGLHKPTAVALANDGSLMIADSGTGPRQQVLFYNVLDLNRPKLLKAFGDEGMSVCAENHVWSPDGDEDLFLLRTEADFNRLIEVTDGGIRVKFDPVWLLKPGAGEQPVPAFERLLGYVDILDLKDCTFPEGNLVPPGTGAVDFSALAKLAADSQIRHLAVEAEHHMQQEPPITEPEAIDAVHVSALNFYKRIFETV